MTKSIIQEFPFLISLSIPKFTDKKYGCGTIKSHIQCGIYNVAYTMRKLLQAEEMSIYLIFCLSINLCIYVLSIYLSKLSLKTSQDCLQAFSLSFISPIMLSGLCIPVSSSKWSIQVAFIFLSWIFMSSVAKALAFSNFISMSYAVSCQPHP